MRREVAAYETLSEPGIPRLVETNAGRFADPAFRLYVATDLVDGPTLEKRVAGTGPISAPEAIALTLRLLDIVTHCHDASTLHRDIKHDNIILRSDAAGDPVLIDFGLSFNTDDDPADMTTKVSQEIGNRFLRLPEFAIGSLRKHDGRSDLTSVVGVLLYAITGHLPVQLVDDQNQMPHQRPLTARAIAAAVDATACGKLVRLFDRAFQHELDGRWQTADDLVRAVRDVLLPAAAPPTTVDESRRRIDELAREARERRFGATRQALQACSNHILERTSRRRVGSCGWSRASHSCWGSTDLTTLRGLPA